MRKPAIHASARWKSLAAAALLALVFAAGCRTGRPSGGEPELSRLPLASPDSVNRLMNEGHPTEALGLLRRMEAVEPVRPPDFHEAVARVLSAAANETRMAGKLRIPETRSATEKQALIQEALARIEFALGATRTASDSSRYLALRAQILAVWGFPREAVLEWRRADQCQRLAGATRQQAALTEHWLVNPQDEDAGMVPAPR